MLMQIVWMRCEVGLVICGYNYNFRSSEHQGDVWVDAMKVDKLSAIATTMCLVGGAGYGR